MDQAPYAPMEYADLFFELFEASSDVVFITRMSDGTILDFNATALSLFGFDRNEAVGRTTIELRLWVDPHARDAFIAAIREHGRVKGLPVRFRSRWSEEFTLMLSGLPVRLRGEDAILGVGVLSKPG